jgi:hypothetical protein
MEQETSSTNVTGDVTAAGAAAALGNPLIECLLRGGHPREIQTLIRNTPAIANSCDAQGSPKISFFNFSHLALRGVVFLKLYLSPTYFRTSCAAIYN